ncbi:MAG: protein-L-isoaspartate(D-aspartate) O-methyltransferase [Bacteroidales bacterium]|nr:protein-L-isoaspartate(D-aspartate) O-methyltransferase [Bacteroidales bacterium]
MEDNFRHKGLRKRLVEEIKKKGINQQPVLDAIESIPRHLFLDPVFLEFAYQDKPFPIGCEQTISQPYTVAFQTQLLEIKARDKVLEVGTGSGYQACVLLEIGARVYSIERIKKLYEKTKLFLPKIGYRPKLFYGDGYKGLPTFAPFDKIIITAGAPFIPDELIDQLKPGGILVAPIGVGGVQTMVRWIKQLDGVLTKETHGSFAFVPMLENKSEE